MTSCNQSSCKYLDVTSDGEALLIRLAAPLDFRTGPHGGKRLARSRILFRNFVRDNDGNWLSNDTARLRSTQIMLPAAQKLDRRLSSIFDAPISAKTVRMVLDISNSELSRWDRDGRLQFHKRQRVSSSRNGFSVAVYSPDLIAFLERCPEVVTRWRSQDDTAPDRGH